MAKTDKTFRLKQRTLRTCHPRHWTTMALKACQRAEGLGSRDLRVRSSDGQTEGGWDEGYEDNCCNGELHRWSSQVRAKKNESTCPQGSTVTRFRGTLRFETAISAFLLTPVWRYHKEQHPRTSVGLLMKAKSIKIIRTLQDLMLANPGHAFKAESAKNPLSQVAGAS